MALSQTVRLNARVVDNGAFGGSGDFTSGSFTTVANSLLVAFVMIDHQAAFTEADIPTPTTGGENWTKVRSAFNTGRTFSADVILYIKDNASSGSKTFAMSGASSWDTAPGSIDLLIYEYTGAAAVASQTATGVSSTSTSDSARDPGTQTITLPETPASTSYLHGAFASDTDQSSATVTPGTSWTEDHERASGGTFGPYLVSETQSRTGTTTTSVTWNDLSAGGNQIYDYALVGWEVRVADSGITGTVAQTLAAYTSSASGDVVNPASPLAVLVRPVRSGLRLNQ